RERSVRGHLDDRLGLDALDLLREAGQHAADRFAVEAAERVPPRPFELSLEQISATGLCSGNLLIQLRELRVDGLGGGASARLVALQCDDPLGPAADCLEPRCQLVAALAQPPPAARLVAVY